MQASKWWTEERVSKLIALDKEGLSASQIRNVLGAASRSAVIGKLHRLGITDPKRVFRRQFAHLNQAPRAPKPTAPKSPKLRATSEAPGAPVQPPVKMAGPTLASLNLRITDPGFGGCRWPTLHDGEDHRFCCVPTTGQTYCAEHTKRSVNKRPLTAPTSANDLARSLRRHV